MRTSILRGLRWSPALLIAPLALVAGGCTSTSEPSLPNYGWKVEKAIHGGLSHLNRSSGPAVVDGRPASEWYVGDWQERFDSALDFGFNGAAQLGLMRYVYPAGEGGALWERPLLGSLAFFRMQRPELLRDESREAMASPATRVSEGNQVAQLERLAPAFEAFLTSYGSQCFPGVLGDEVLQGDVALVHAATRTLSDDQRRGVLQALGL